VPASGQVKLTRRESRKSQNVFRCRKNWYYNCGTRVCQFSASLQHRNSAALQFRTILSVAARLNIPVVEGIKYRFSRLFRCWSEKRIIERDCFQLFWARIGYESFKSLLRLQSRRVPLCTSFVVRKQPRKTLNLAATVFLELYMQTGDNYVKCINFMCNVIVLWSSIIQCKCEITPSLAYRKRYKTLTTYRHRLETV